MTEAQFQTAIFGLKECLKSVPTDPALSKIIGAKQRVLERYGNLFSPDSLGQLTAEEFRSFLYLENNYHWTQLYRRGNAAANDIDTLRHGLSILLDEQRSISDRWNLVQVSGLGKATKSAILLVEYPERYGVWNGVSERGLERFGLFPFVSPKRDKGRTYEAVNERLKALASAIETDLWTLDGLWWAMDPDRSPGVIEQLSRIH